MKLEVATCRCGYAWKYTSYYDGALERRTRYCEKCERIEKATFLGEYCMSIREWVVFVPTTRFITKSGE